MESDLLQMITNPQFKSRKMFDADISHGFRKQMTFKTNVVRPDVRNTTASYEIKLEKKCTKT